MIHDMETFTNDVEESELLGRFLGVIKKFNFNKPIKD